jgi:hypothetical protein
VHEVVPEEGRRHLHDDDDHQAEALGQVVSVLSANVPLTLLTANQPMPAPTDISALGSMLPQ